MKSIPPLLPPSLWGVAVLLASPAAAASATSFLKNSDAWFATPEAGQIAAHILAHQTASGGWPKNTDTTSAPRAAGGGGQVGSFDNQATLGELRFLARRVSAADDAPCRDAFERGLRFILNAQYPTGGWPQRYPPGNDYHRHITFNDASMVRLMEFLMEVSDSETYRFLPDESRQVARAAFDRGIACILQCQIVIDGRPTGWCAQHDEVDFSPRGGRSYEPASLGPAETAGIVRLLMKLESPPAEVRQAVRDAVRWLESVRIEGVRMVTIEAPAMPGGKDRQVREDPGAPPLWARFIDLQTRRPVFLDRDGIPKPALADIGHERRNGYAWYGNWPQRLLDREVPDWNARQSRPGE